MTSAATYQKRAEEAERRGVNAGSLVLSEAKALAKVTGAEKLSARIGLGIQFVAMAALEEGASANDVLNAFTESTGWALAALAPADPAQRFAIFSAMTADMLAMADNYRKAAELAESGHDGEA